MDFRVVCSLIGRLILAECASMAVPLALALGYGEESAASFIASMAVCLVVSYVCIEQGVLKDEKLTMREGIAVTGLGWLSVTVLGMLPYLCGGYLGLLDGIFESISGFTGTGATVIPDLSPLPSSILFWRMMTHWFGGLGIIVIFLAILPQAGQSSVYMYEAESTGPTSERVMPRLHEMTIALFKLYIFLTSVAALVYFLCGMTPEIAVTHAMSTIGTGGFSTYNDNAMHFASPVVEIWMTVFMILAGGNFGLYYKIWRKGPHVIRQNTEFKAYILILALAMTAIAADLVWAKDLDALTAFRYASFQVGSLSTTGFVSTDFDQWPAFSKGVLLMLMIMGGCAGSTASGVKVSRIVLLVKNAAAVVRQKLAPRHVVEVRMNGRLVDEDTLMRVGQFFFLYIFFILVWTLILTACGLSTFDSFGLSVTTMGNIGPAFGIAGATCTYAGLPAFVKAVLCFAMLLGRLELYTLLVMLRPDFWQTSHRW